MEFKQEVSAAESAAMELLQYEQQFINLLENAKLYCSLLDSHGKVIAINNSMLERTGWKREELRHRDWTENLIAPEYCELANNIKTLLQENLIDSTKYLENEILSKNGERIKMGWSCSPLKDSKGNFMGITYIGEPITSPSPRVGNKRDSLGRRSSLQLENLFPLVKISPETIGDYVILKPLGKDVMLARHQQTEEIVAIKFITKKNLTEEELSRARREITILQQLKTLQNPHIVRLVDSFETETHLVLIQEYVSGGELVAWINKTCGLSEPTALRLFHQLLSALQCCHQNSIVHRDIKLENILMDENSNIKLIDFGSAAYIKSGPFDVFVGTIDYAAPEVLAGKPYRGTEQDVWALGILLYTIIYKENPFYSIDEIMDRDLRIPYILSEESIDLIRCMLDRDVAKRYDINQVLEHPWCQAAVEE